jgi:hypothetical protein
MIIVLLLGHSAEMCPLPLHLWHCILLLRVVLFVVGGVEDALAETTGFLS